MKYYVGLDIGTSSVKGVLISEDGTDKKTAHKAFDYEYPKKNLVQISAESYLDSCLSVIRTLAGKLPKGAIIEGISEASASGNLLLLNDEGVPITPIYSWQSKRVTEDDYKVLGDDFDKDKYYDIIGWPTQKGFPLAELCLIKRRTPQLLDKAAMVCMSTEYLNYVLTGKWGISTSAGTPFFLIDQKKGAYYKPVLDMLGISEAQLPPIVKIGTAVGTVTHEAEELCGLKEGVSVIAGGFDHPMGARGTNVLREGQLLLSCGTSWVGFFPVRDREKIIKNRLLCDPFLSPEGCFAAMYSLAAVSDGLKWYIEKYIDSTDNMYQKLGELASHSQHGAGGLRINPYERCEIKGYSKNDIARAIMESVCYRLKEKLDGLAQNGIKADCAVMSGGPTAIPLWVDIVQTILGIPITVADGTYSGAVGAARVAQK